MNMNLPDHATLQFIGKKLNSALEARMLIRHVTGLSDADLITMNSIELNENQKATLDNMISQRLNGRPISKIIGKKEFYGRDFIVSDDVLDPRPDSEILIEEVLKQCNSSKHYNILDLGTGSGCLALTLLAQLPNTQAVATDISDGALSVAKENADNLNLFDRIEFMKSNWFDDVEGQFDIIISNPPYIESIVIPTLEKEVKSYDPMGALDGGEDGLNPYKVILPQIRNYLTPNGFFVLEHGYNQQDDIIKLAQNEGFTNISGRKDYNQNDRIIIAKAM